MNNSKMKKLILLTAAVWMLLGGGLAQGIAFGEILDTTTGGY